MRITVAIFLFVLVFVPLGDVFAQSDTNQFEGVDPGVSSPQEFYRAEVVEILEESEQNAGDYINHVQVFKARIIGGLEAGNEVEILDEGVLGLNKPFRLNVGDKIIVGKLSQFGEPFYFVADKYRLPSLGWVLAIFFAVAVLFGGIRGFTSILGLAVSILVLAIFVVPQILSGRDPLVVTVLGAVMIVCVSLFLAHGFKKRTVLAFLSTIITFGLAAVISKFFVDFTALFGLGSEGAFYLQVFPEANINLKGLLLGGILIGTLGVLDDVTTTQTAAVDELARANPGLSRKELYRRGLSIGREHIASLVNTLALAYAGAALPLFLLFSLNADQPLWVILNGEIVAEEVVRTLAGSLALILAVPISTLLAAKFIGRSKKYPQV